MKRLLLVRHGESEANLVHSLDCAVPGPPLTGLGRLQAMALASALSDADVRVVYASTMLRAQQTAQPLAKRFGLPVEVRAGLREFDVGDLQARTDRAAHLLLRDLMDHWLMRGEPDAARPGGESARQVVARFGAEVAEVLAGYDEGTAVVAAHGGVLRLAVPELTPTVPREFTRYHHLPNVGVIELVVGADGLACRHYAGIAPSPGLRDQGAVVVKRSSTAPITP